MPFADDFSPTPYWTHNHAPYNESSVALPNKTDVLIIGSGYTGLQAAYQTGAAGRPTVVLEAGAPGAGCSTRNGGQIDSSIKPSIDELTPQYGAERAIALHKEGTNARDWLEDFIAQNHIDCHFKRIGRFHAAHTPRAYRQLCDALPLIHQQEDPHAYAVPRSEQRTQLGSDFYYGGLVFPSCATLHPARYHQGLQNLVRAQGTEIVAHCRAQSIKKTSDGYIVQTQRGAIHAQHVCVATNGYSTQLLPWLQRRVIPIGSYMIATQPVCTQLLDDVFPQRRIVTDTRKVVYYYGPAADQSRIIFGGRVSAGEIDPKISAPRLYAQMIRLFPQLKSQRISHAWQGFVAFTFDDLPHCGTHEGVHYSAGYCGSGIALSSYLGMRMGQRVLGKACGQTAFDGLRFPTRPFYYGKPWFLSAIVRAYQWRDRWQSWSAHKFQ